MNEAIFNYVHHLPHDRSDYHQVSPTAWYSILKQILKVIHVDKDVLYSNTGLLGSVIIVKYKEGWNGSKDTVEWKRPLNG